MQSFRAIFAHPGTAAMSAAAFVGRFPMGMLGLSVTLLVVSATGSYAIAGAVAAATTVAGAFGGPIGARLADRFGQDRAIPPLIGLHLLALAGLTVAVLAGTPVWSWLALATVAGLTGPNLGAMVRARWAGIASDSSELTTAFAFESMLDEVAFVVGPPLATALAVAIAPWSAIATGLLLAASGALALAAQRRTQPPPNPGAAHEGPPIWRNGTLQVLTLLMLLMGGVFGALEVSTVAFAEESGALAATGWLLGVFALSSGLTGLALGARPGGWRLSSQILVGAAMVAAATAALPFVDGLVVYGAAMFGSGLGVSAVMIGAFQVIERALPRARLTESLALSISGVLIGSAAAVALAGALIDARGSSYGLAVGSASAALGLLVALISRPALARAEALGSAERPDDRPAGPAARVASGVRAVEPSKDSGSPGIGPRDDSGSRDVAPRNDSGSPDGLRPTNSPPRGVQPRNDSGTGEPGNLAAAPGSHDPHPAAVASH